MAKHSEPVVLELAALPREQMGPFLLLGIDKSAGKSAIERIEDHCEEDEIRRDQKIVHREEVRQRIDAFAGISFIEAGDVHRPEPADGVAEGGEAR